MDLGLAGQRAAVMAASEGLGLASAMELAKEGASVAICGRREDVLQAAAKRIADETRADVVALPCDLATPEGPASFVDAAAEAFGGLDVLVTNKGGPPGGRFEDVDDAAWQRGFELTVLSYVRGVRAALPHLRAAGGGAVVGIESSSVREGIRDLVLSNSLRPCVVGLSRSLAREHASESIRFNLVLPGSMDTERIQDLTRYEASRRDASYDETMKARLDAIPLGRLGEPAELGRLVAWLASPAASYVTGQAVLVDGGVVRGLP